MHWFFLSRNIVICRSGQHRSVANAELCSNTWTRCSRHQHSISLLHLSDLDFWENTCARNFSECSKESLRVFQEQCTCSCARSSDRPLDDHEHVQGPAQPPKDPLDEERQLPQTSKKRATSATAIPAETNLSRGILDELAERLGGSQKHVSQIAGRGER